MHPQLQPFPYNQNIFLSSQEPPNQSVLDDVHNYDFGNGSYESLLNGDQTQNERLLIEDLAASKPLFPLPPNPPTDLQYPIKAEPYHASLSPFHSSGPDYMTPTTQQELTSETQVSEAPAAVVLSTMDTKMSAPEVQDTPTEAKKRSTTVEATVVPKEEDLSCILISD